MEEGDRRVEGLLSKLTMLVYFSHISHLEQCFSDFNMRSTWYWICMNHLDLTKMNIKYSPTGWGLKFSQTLTWQRERWFSGDTTGLDQKLPWSLLFFLLDVCFIFIVLHSSVGFADGSDYLPMEWVKSGSEPHWRKWQPTQLFLPEKSHGQRSLGVLIMSSKIEMWHSNWTTTFSVSKVFRS